MPISLYKILLAFYEVCDLKFMHKEDNLNILKYKNIVNLFLIVYQTLFIFSYFQKI